MNITLRFYHLWNLIYWNIDRKGCFARSSAHFNFSSMILIIVVTISRPNPVPSPKGLVVKKAENFILYVIRNS